MLKILGLIALCTAIGAVGFIYCDRMTHRKRYLEKLILFTANCANIMRYSHRSIFDIFKEHGVKELRLMQLLTKDNLTDRTAVNELLIANGIATADRVAVADFILSLSSGDIKELTSSCEYYKCKFEQLSHEAEKDINEKGKLFRSLFVLFGVALFIILI